MNEFLIPISDNEFKSKVVIKFDNILEGFNLFNNFTIKADNTRNGEEKIIKFIYKIFEENNFEAYIDFYISKISDKDKKQLISLISNEDKNILNVILNSNLHDGVFYKLTSKNIIPFLVRLNTREVFFVTFYFINKPITIWGNYNMNFPCFVNAKENFNLYHDIWKSLDSYN